MRIAVSAESASIESRVDPRFGRAKCFMVYDDETRAWESFDNQQNLQAAQGAGIQSAANVVNRGCGVLISGHCGPKAFAALSKAGLAVFTTGDQTVRDALAAYQAGTLKMLDTPDVDGHW